MHVIKFKRSDELATAKREGREGRAGRANPGAYVSSVIGQFLTVMRLESWTGRLGRRVGVADGEDRCWERGRCEGVARVELPFGSQIRSFSLQTAAQLSSSTGR